MSTSQPENSPYHLSDEGISWRHTQLPGMLGIPSTDVVSYPENVRRFMRFGRWPLILEQEEQVVGTVVPFRANTVANIDQYSASSLSYDELKTTSHAALLQTLASQAIIVTESDTSKPTMILSSYDNHRRDEFVADFNELLDMDDEKIAAGQYVFDPDSGIAFANEVFMDPFGQDLVKDMKAARARRLGRQE